MSAIYDDAGTTYDSAIYDSATAVRIELLLAAVWTDITRYVRIAEGIQITRGRQDEQAAFAGAQCALTLDNRDGRFSPRYSSGAYYGLIGRNTQLRVSMLDQSSFSYKVRFHGAVSEWPVTFDPTFNEGTVSVTADGPRRRLLRDTALQSAYLRAELSLSNLVGYWPMEDGSTSSQFAAAAGNNAGTFTAVDLASSSIFVASSDLPTLTTASSSVRFPVPAYATSVTGQQVRLLFACSGSADTTQLVVDTIGAHQFVLTYTPAANTLRVTMLNYSTGATEYDSGAVTWTTESIPSGVRLSFDFHQNGTGIDWTVIVLAPGATGGHFISGNITSSTFGRITNVSVANSGPGAQATVGHLSVENQITSIFDLAAVLDSYAGESAASRVDRLTNEIPTTITIDAAIGSAAMGPQGRDTFLTLIDECATVDDGISTELVDNFGLHWRARSQFYSKDVSFALSMSRVRALTPVDDDQLTENDVTVSRANGSSYRSVSTDAAMGPAAIGTYATSYDLNLYTDTQVRPQAEWRMAEGTVNKPRVPSIVFDANKLLTTTLPSLFALREGDTFGLTTANPVMLNAYGLDSPCILRVTGWVETVTDVEWLFELQAVPSAPYGVLILDDISYGVLETSEWRLAL